MTKLKLLWEKKNLNKEAVNNNSVYFKLSNLIKWESTDLKMDDNYNDHNAEKMYVILSKWLTIKLRETITINLTTNNQLKNSQKNSDEFMVSNNWKTPTLINVTRNDQLENAQKSSNEDFLPNNQKTIHSETMEKMRLPSICKHWVKYHVNTFHITLNTKRVKKFIWICKVGKNQLYNWWI